MPYKLVEDSNLFIPSISVSCTGVADKRIEVKEEDNDTLLENRAIIGSPIKINYTGNDEIECVISYDYKNYVNDWGTSNLESIILCEFDGEDFIPIDTFKDEQNTQLYAKVKGEGTFFLLNVEEFLNNVGINIENTQVQVKAYSTNNAKGKDEANTSQFEVINNPNDVPEEWYQEYQERIKNNRLNSIDSMNKVRSYSVNSNDSDGSKPKGQADITFVIDTTGSMWGAINNVTKNINEFVDKLTTEYNVQINFSLVDYKDITSDGVESTQIVKNGMSNWYSNVEAYKSNISSLYVSGGGDEPETAIDGLALASKLNYRSNVNKFVILVTDAGYKVDNSHGISSMDDMANLLSKKGIITSVIAPTSVKELYSSLYETTNGIFADIYGDFSNELMKLADRIGEAVNDGVWILLNDYQYIKLLDEVSSTNGIDTDKDGVSDYSELGKKVEKDLTSFVNFMLGAYGIPEKYYTGKRTVTVYTYKSNPVLADTDYDGVNDNKDENVRDNCFKSVLNTFASHSPISYKMDYRAFFRDNSSYSEQLGIVSSIYSSVVYPGNNYGGIDIEEYMEMHGLSDIRRYDLKSIIKPLDDHLSEAYIGHRKVAYKGQEKEIVAVFIRGTNGTIEEWTSNFDIGSTEERRKVLDYGSIEEKEAIKDWIVADNHMGFDITANRILRCLREYESEGYVDSSIEKVYWITGHSRGAGIANILGARLIDEGNTVYAYTYASPNTTTKSNANSYKGIFNILNKDDFVPCLPMEVWAFKHYGKNVIISLADNYEKEWEKMTGKFDYNPDSFGMEETIKAMGEIAKDRNECYRYTCVCHGDGTLNNITETIYEISQKFREDAIDKIPTNALSYCKIIREDVDWLSRWKFKICQLPEYFMQVIAAFMVDKEKYKFVIEMNMAPRYQSAKRKICLSALGGLEHPHYVESYYVLSKHISSNQFN